jgi:hypothetical protein
MARAVWKKDGRNGEDYFVEKHIPDEEFATLVQYTPEL